MKYMVVVPTYNEAANIKILISGILKLSDEYHVMVVDDNSPDGTYNVVKELAIHNKRIFLIHRQSKLGLGSAYVAGFKKAIELGAEYIFEMDADHSHDYHDLPRFINEMDNHDLVIGSRYVQGVSVIDWPLYRLLISYIGNVYARLVTGLKTSDNTSGFKCFKSTVLKAVDLDSIHSNGYAFQLEMNYRSWKRGFRLCEIPIIFWGRYSGESKMTGHIVSEAIFVVWKLKLEFFIKRITGCWRRKK